LYNTTTTATTAAAAANVNAAAANGSIQPSGEHDEVAGL